MNRTLLTVALLISLVPEPALAAGAGMHAPNLINAVFIDRVEWLGAGQSRLEASGWYGNEFDKAIWDLELEESASETEWTLNAGGEWAISPFWNAQALLRADIDDDDEDFWVGAGFSGLAPWFIHTDALIYAGDGAALIDLHGEHEFMLSRHWVMVSSLEGEWQLGDVAASGLQELELGVRFRYETVSRFSAYAGVEWQVDGVSDDDRIALLAGLSYWF